MLDVLDTGGRLIESRIRRGNPEYAHGILNDIRNFVLSVRDEYLEYRNSRLEDLRHAQAPRKRRKGVVLDLTHPQRLLPPVEFR